MARRRFTDHDHLSDARVADMIRGLTPKHMRAFAAALRRRASKAAAGDSETLKAIAGVVDQLAKGGAP